MKVINIFLIICMSVGFLVFPFSLTVKDGIVFVILGYVITILSAVAYALYKHD